MNKNTQDDYPTGAKSYPGDRMIGTTKSAPGFPSPDRRAKELRATGTKQKSVTQPAASFSSKKKFAR